MPCRGTDRSARREPRAAGWAGHRQRPAGPPPQPCSPGIHSTCVQVTCVPPCWVCVPPCSPDTPSAHVHTRVHSHTHAPACAPTRARLRAPPPGPLLAGHAAANGQLAQRGVGAHLEVPVDDPHLMAVQNRLQDLLDTVTVANSRRVSEGGLEGQGCGNGLLCGTGVTGKQRVKVPPTAQGRRC